MPADRHQFRSAGASHDDLGHPALLEPVHASMLRQPSLGCPLPEPFA
jgi:hypothetical protein